MLNGSFSFLLAYLEFFKALNVRKSCHLKGKKKVSLPRRQDFLFVFLCVGQCNLYRICLPWNVSEADLKDL